MGFVVLLFVSRFKSFECLLEFEVFFPVKITILPELGTDQQNGCHKTDSPGGRNNHSQISAMSLVRDACFG